MIPPSETPPATAADRVDRPVGLPCPYCRGPLTARADGGFSCRRCGDFTNYGRMYTKPADTL